MKTFKTLLKLGIACSMLFTSANVLAQLQTPEASSAEAMANNLTKYETDELKLDAKEATDLAQINLIYAQRLQEIRKKNSSNNSKNEIEALKRSHSQKVKSLLSSEKYQQYLALKKKEQMMEQEEKKQ